MKKLMVAKDFSKAACEVLGIDINTHPVLGVDVKTEKNGIVEIHVRFAVPCGLFSQIEMAMKKD